MNIAIQYILAILAFSIIIVVHEFGHFIFAKINGIFVEEFFIGMGPKILKFKTKSGTQWGLAAIPLGGYNKIIGMDRDEEVPLDKKDKVFYSKPFWVKFLVLNGGAFFNILFALILIIVFFNMGVFVPTNQVDYIENGSPAQIYGIQKGDKIVSINNIQINTWDDFSENVKKFPDKEVTFKIIRDGKEINIQVVLDNKDGIGYLGVSPTVEKQKMGFRKTLIESFRFLQDFIVSYFKLLGMLFTGGLSLEEARPVSPIGVVAIMQQSASMGLQFFVMMIALISLLLGFTNVIPLLPLDGGHIIVAISEAIIKRPLSKKAIQIYNSIGIVIFIALFLIGFMFDIFKPIDITNM